MKQLWAPWRMAYIDGLKEPVGCFLCEAAASASDDREKLVVLRGSHCIALLNRYPYNNGHLLVAPKAHKADLFELSDAENLELMRMSARLQRTLLELMQPQGFNLGINFGQPAGAGLPGHLHIHLVPRWSGDTNFMTVLSNIKVLPMTLESVYDSLTDALKKST